MRLPRLLFSFCCAFVALHAADLTIDRGQLPSGTAYTALKPRTWNQKRVLILAPSQRATASAADAALDPSAPLVRALLAEHWLVATFAYRRPGIVIKDSLEDLTALRAHLAATHGAPDRVYVLGENLGAGVAVRVIENFPDEFAGALAVGGPFDLQEPAPTIGVAFAPQRPLLLLPNQSESHAPETYVKTTARTEHPPVLWKIARDGRANSNTAERLAALAALVAWVEEGRVPPQNFDATVPPPARASSVTFTADRSAATGRVTALDPVRGDLTLDFQPADLDALGLARGSFFAVIVTDASGGSRTLRVLYGQNLRAAKPGDWFALPEAEGGLLLCVHRGHAASVSGLAIGSTVTLRRLRDE